MIRMAPPKLLPLPSSGDACEYSRRATNIGGDANILRGATAGTGEYVWVIGDDDVLLPGAIAETLRMIDADRPDRIIHFTPEAAGLVPRGHTGTMGTLIDTLGDDASLLIAATLISANVYRRASLDTLWVTRRLRHTTVTSTPASAHSVFAWPMSL
jgi:hypothetical protein